MGRSLEFALSTMIVSLIHIGLSFFVASIISNKITELFDPIIKVLTML